MVVAYNSHLLTKCQVETIGFITIFGANNNKNAATNNNDYYYYYYYAYSHKHTSLLHNCNPDCFFAKQRRAE